MICPLFLVYSFFYIYEGCSILVWPGQLGLQNTLTASLQRGKISPMSVLDITLKKSDGEASVMLEHWGMHSTPLLLSLPGPLWPGMVAPDRALSMGQIELNCNYAKLNCLKLIIFTFNSVFKQVTYVKLNF